MGPHSPLQGEIILYIYLKRLFVGGSVWHEGAGWLLNSELERTWKEAVVACFEAQHLPGGAEEANEKPHFFIRFRADI